MFMANDIIEVLLDLDMQPKPELLWWTSTHKDEDVAVLTVVSRSKVWDPRFMVFFFFRDGKGGGKTLRKVLGAGGVMGTVAERKVFPF